MRNNLKRKKPMEREDGLEKSVYMAAAIGVGIILILLIVLSIVDAQYADISDVGNQIPRASLEPSQPVNEDTPLESIKYEDTFMYQEEIDALTKIIEKVIFVEARGECIEGKIAVGASVVNRLESQDFPNTIEKVLKAYASILNITDNMLKKVPECREAAERAVKGEDPLEEILGGPTFYFYNPEIADKDEVEKRKNIAVTYKIGNHVFYSEWK